MLLHGGIPSLPVFGADLVIAAALFDQAPQIRTVVVMGNVAKHHSGAVRQPYQGFGFDCATAMPLRKFASI